MADFSRDPVEPLRSHTTPTSPVQNRGGVDLFNSLTEGVKNFWSIRASGKKTGSLGDDPELGMALREVDKWNSAFRQGKIKGPEYRTQINAVSANLIHRRPELGSRWYKSLAGLTNIKAPEDTAEVFRRKETESAYTNRFIYPGMAEEDFTKGMANYRKWDIWKKSVADATADIEFRRKKEGLSTEVAKREALEVLAPGAKIINERTAGTFKHILTQYQKGAYGPGGEKKAEELIRLALADNRAILMENSKGLVSTDQLNFALGPTEKMAEFYIKSIKGDIDEENLKTKLANLTAMGKMDFIKSDPRVLPLVSASALLRNTDLSTVGVSFDVVSKYLARAGSTPGTTGGLSFSSPDIYKRDGKEGHDTRRAYYGAISEGIDKYSSGSVDATDKVKLGEELKNTLVNTLRGVDAYSRIYRDQPEKYKETIKFLAGDKFRKAVELGLVDKADANVASKVLARVYQGRVVPLIKDTWDRSHSYIQKDLSKWDWAPKDVLKIEVNETGVHFAKNGKAPNGIEWDNLLDPHNWFHSLDNEVDRVNEELAPVINQLLRARVNLTGETMEQAWNKMLGEDFDFMAEIPTELAETIVTGSTRTGSEDVSNKDTTGGDGTTIKEEKPTPSKKATEASGEEKATKTTPTTTTTPKTPEKAPVASTGYTMKDIVAEAQKRMPPGLDPLSPLGATRFEELKNEVKAEFDAKKASTASTTGGGGTVAIGRSEPTAGKIAAGSSTSSTAGPTTIEEYKNLTPVKGKRTIHAAKRLVKEHKIDPTLAAGIIGRFMAESGQNLDTTAVGDNGTAFGIAQWRGQRFRDLKKFAAERGKDWRDLDVNIDYFIWEIQNHPKRTNNFLKYLKEAGSLEDVIDAMMHFEAPAGYVRGQRKQRGVKSWNKTYQYALKVLKALEAEG